MKFALWAVFIILLIWLLRGKKAVPGKSAQAAQARPAKTDGVESMVRCAHCGVYVPASESVVTQAGIVFCSEEHRLRHAA